MLHYFKTNALKEMKGVIVIAEARVHALVGAEASGKKFAFAIEDITNGRVYKVAASNVNEQQIWMRSLQSTMHEENKHNVEGFSDGKVIFEGELIKMGAQRKNWKR